MRTAPRPWVHLRRRCWLGPRCPSTAVAVPLAHHEYVHLGGRARNTKQLAWPSSQLALQLASPYLTCSLPDCSRFPWIRSHRPGRWCSHSTPLHHPAYDETLQHAAPSNPARYHLVKQPPLQRLALYLLPYSDRYPRTKQRRVRAVRLSKYTVG